MKGSDLVAKFLAERKIKYVFGIIGAGNAHIFDSIHNLGYTQIVCVHHEQAACMAIQTFYRTRGEITAALLTTGAGSTNGITGVVSAWADSIPGIIISGNEHFKYVSSHKNLRMWGVQGYDSSLMVEKVTKYAKRVESPNQIIFELEKAYEIALDGRKGPCWIDIPMNVQSENTIDGKEEKIEVINHEVIENKELSNQIQTIVEGLKEAKRPLFWFGNGVRLSNAEDLLLPLIEKLNIPTILSWAGIDMIDSNHALVYGRAGTYGQRCANLILQNCDFLICVGTRLATTAQAVRTDAHRGQRHSGQPAGPGAGARSTDLHRGRFRAAASRPGRLAAGPVRRRRARWPAPGAGRLLAVLLLLAVAWACCACSCWTRPAARAWPMAAPGSRTPGAGSQARERRQPGGHSAIDERTADGGRRRPDATGHGDRRHHRRHCRLGELHGGRTAQPGGPGAGHGGPRDRHHAAGGADLDRTAGRVHRAAARDPRNRRVGAADGRPHQRRVGTGAETARWRASRCRRPNPA
jgi:hypothetical protein